MTPAISTVQRAGVSFALHEYAHEAGARSFGMEAAQKLGVSPSQIFKTLVASLDDARLVVGLVPADRSLDVKALAAASGGKRASLSDPVEAERSTGYVTGGISPLGQRRRLLTIIDESALEHERIYVSAGRRGLQIELAPRDLLHLCGARTAPIAR